MLVVCIDHEEVMNEFYMYKGGAGRHSESFQLVSEILPLWFLYLHLIGYRGTGDVQLT